MPVRTPRAVDGRQIQSVEKSWCQMKFGPPSAAVECQTSCVNNRSESRMRGKLVCCKPSSSLKHHPRLSEFSLILRRDGRITVWILFLSIARHLRQKPTSHPLRTSDVVNICKRMNVNSETGDKRDAHSHFSSVLPGNTLISTVGI